MKIPIILLWEEGPTIENLSIIFIQKNKEKYIKDEKVKFGKRLDEIIRDRNITQESLSVITGIQSSDITDYIKGNHNITLYNMVKMADNLKIRIKDFFDHNSDIPKSRLLEETMPRKRKPKNNS